MARDDGGDVRSHPLPLGLVRVKQDAVQYLFMAREVYIVIADKLAIKYNVPTFYLAQNNLPLGCAKTISSFKIMLLIHMLIMGVVFGRRDNFLMLR